MKAHLTCADELRIQIQERDIRIKELESQLKAVKAELQTRPQLQLVEPKEEEAKEVQIEVIEKRAPSLFLHSDCKFNDPLSGYNFWLPSTYSIISKADNLQASQVIKNQLEDGDYLGEIVVYGERDIIYLIDQKKCSILVYQRNDNAITLLKAH